VNKALLYATMASLTLGLAPFFPHAHIYKQLRNLWLGRHMDGMAWFDLALHGTPWLVLIGILIAMAYKRLARK